VWSPRITTSCVDCGVGTITLGEWYMVKERVWKQAWKGRRKPLRDEFGIVSGQAILCIGCLEQRIGRRLVKSDFTRAPVNDLSDYDYKSDRLIDRLTRLNRGRPKKGEKNGSIERLMPAHER